MRAPWRGPGASVHRENDEAKGRHPHAEAGGAEQARGYAATMAVSRAGVVLGLLGVGAALLTPRAHAEPWVEGRAGTGISSGHYTFEERYRRLAGDEAIAHDEGGPLGIPIMLGAAGGYALSPTVALGIAGRIELTPYVESVRPRYAEVSAHLLLGVGPTLVLRPGKSLDLRLAMQWVWGSFSGSIQEIGAEDNVFDIRPVSGPGGYLSLGCCAERGFGIAAEVHVARLTSEHTLFIPVTTTLLATLASR
jgi:hypothetical protein